MVSVTLLNSNILARKQSQTIYKTWTWLLSTKTFFTKTRREAGFGQQVVVFSPLPVPEKDWSRPSQKTTQTKKPWAGSLLSWCLRFLFNTAPGYTGFWWRLNRLVIVADSEECSKPSLTCVEVCCPWLCNKVRVAPSHCPRCWRSHLEQNKAS